MYYNFQKIFKLRGITQPFVYLIKHGFPRGQAYQFTKLRNDGLRIKNLERLCLLLECTPNDIIEWIPPKDFQIPETHPLHKLKPKAALDFSNITKDVPIEKMTELMNAIMEAKVKLKSE